VDSSDQPLLISPLNSFMLLPPIHGWVSSLLFNPSFHLILASNLSFPCLTLFPILLIVVVVFFILFFYPVYLAFAFVHMIFFCLFFSLLIVILIGDSAIRQPYIAELQHTMEVYFVLLCREKNRIQILSVWGFKCV
jgi:hypothetical protein